MGFTKKLNVYPRHNVLFNVVSPSLRIHGLHSQKRNAISASRFQANFPEQSLSWSMSYTGTQNYMYTYKVDLIAPSTKTLYYSLHLTALYQFVTAADHRSFNVCSVSRNPSGIILATQRTGPMAGCAYLLPPSLLEGNASTLSLLAQCSAVIRALFLVLA